MDPSGNCGSRRRRRWPKEARELVTNYLARKAKEAPKPAQARTDFRKLITDLVSLTGYPRDLCEDFARRHGVKAVEPYKEWTIPERQRLLNLIAVNPPHDVARIMRRSPGSIRVMLHRLGASAQMGRDWFTKSTLAAALHIRVAQVQRWIDLGWLPTRVVQTGALKKEIIDANQFAEFCKRYRTAILGRRLNADRLDFVMNFVFPPSHTELLPVREAKKERAAYEAQTAKTMIDGEEDEPDGSERPTEAEVPKELAAGDEHLFQSSS